MKGVQSLLIITCGVFYATHAHAWILASGDRTTQAVTETASLCRMGGSCISTKDYIVEIKLRPLPYGKVKAWVRDRATQKPVHENLTVKTAILATNGKRYSVDLKWDESKKVFNGALPQNVTPKPGALQVSITPQGKEAQHATGMAAVIPHAMHGGAVIAAGPYAYEVVPREDGQVEAFSIGAYEREHPMQLKLQVTLSGVGKTVPVAMQYNPAQHRYTSTSTTPQKIISGPVGLEVSGVGDTHQGYTAMVNPLGNTELSKGKQMIAGPYTIEVSQGDAKKLMVVIRDSQNKPVSSKQISAVANLHPVAKGKPADNQVSVPLRPSTQKSRFEFELPENVSAFNWIGIKIQPVSKGQRSEEEGFYLGSTRW